MSNIWISLSGPYLVNVCWQFVQLLLHVLPLQQWMQCIFWRKRLQVLESGGKKNKLLVELHGSSSFSEGNGQLVFQVKTIHLDWWRLQTHDAHYLPQMLPDPTCSFSNVRSFYIFNWLVSVLWFCEVTLNEATFMVPLLPLIFISALRVAPGLQQATRLQDLHGFPFGGIFSSIWASAWQEPAMG